MLSHAHTHANTKTEPAMKMLRGREATFDLPGAHDRWWKVNAYQAGFYRVHYSEVMLPKLGTAIQNKEISVCPLCERTFLQSVGLVGV